MNLKRTRRHVISRLAGLPGLLAAAGGLAANTMPVDAQSADPEFAAFAKDFTGASLGQVIAPGQAGHNRIRPYNARFDCLKSTTYFRPASVEGVQKVLAWANRHKRTLAIRGGGHSFEGKSSHPQLVLDMSAMNQLRFSGADGLVEAGAGVLLGDVYKLLGPQGFILPAGTCPTVGLVGHALGGGIGDFLPMFGYTAQSLKAVTLVTMSGSVLSVNDKEIAPVDGAPLDVSQLNAAKVMKVLRGGGQGSLGVVTSMTLQAYDVRPMRLHSFRANFDSVSATRAAAIVEAWQQWRAETPEPLKTMMSAKLNFERSEGSWSIDMAGLVAAPSRSEPDIAAARRAADRLFQLIGRPTNISGPLPASAVIRTFLDDNETTRNTKRRTLYGSSSVLPSALPRQGIEHLVRAVPSNVSLSLYTSGGRTKTAPETSLHQSEFIMEWVALTSRADPGLYNRMYATNLEMMRLAGFAPHATPSYADPGERNYFPNVAEIEALRSQLDPLSLSTSSLLARSPTAKVCG